MYGIVGYEMVKEVVKIIAELESSEQTQPVSPNPVVRLLGKLWLPSAPRLAESSDKSNINCTRLEVATQK